MQSRREIRNGAIAYLVWAEANKAEWDVTLHELADKAAAYFNDASITVDVIRGICGKRTKGGQKWLQLIRCTTLPMHPEYAA